MIVAVTGWTRSREGIALHYDAGGRHITKRCTYDDVDFDALHPALVERWAAQLAMMEAVPLAGLAPEAIDFGPASRFCTPRFEQLWRAVWRGTGGQWRYERDRFDYAPELIVRERARGAAPIEAEGDALVFCGGGKDSLASITLLKRADIGFATFAYSHADYGAPNKQHALIDALLDAANVDRRHRMRAEDDIAPRGELICAETPISLFYALPLMLAHRHRYLVLGNERSADAPNFEWRGEAINHQWGKSSAASRLLDEFLRAEWIANGAYFSILAPVHDAVIVSLLRDEPAVPLTHSCNIEKPWCGRCAKCVYVRLQFAAYLGVYADEAFDGNEAVLRELLGLASHKPFECVGEPDETRLALILALRRGLGGDVAQRLARELPPVDVDALAAEYLTVHDDGRMPPQFRERAIPILIETARSAGVHAGWQGAVPAPVDGGGTPPSQPPGRRRS
jgi:UDP-N-acetyl-alpha-D-muramoyl-L-alanyl-L-glutamate epimerase